MRKILIFCLALATLFGTNAVHALEEPIRVLVGRVPNISSSEALGMIGDLNGLMVNSGLSDRTFVNAGAHLGAPNLLVFTSNCPAANYQTMLTCFAVEFGAARVAHDADIVLVMVTSISGGFCGASPDQMINAPTISDDNIAYAYAIVSASCQGSAWVASKLSRLCPARLHRHPAQAILR